jgi:hypothetical protein
MAPSSGVGWDEPTLLGPLETAILIHWITCARMAIAV